MLLVLVVVLSAGGSSRAQNFSLVWSEWETSEVQKQGPERAEGILLYFNRSSDDATKEPIPGVFVEMAKVANWDVLRINRHSFVDGEVSDGDILQVVADRVAQARQQGYRKVVLGGAARGGWLALSAAGLPGVDVAIGLAPGRAYGPAVLTLARDMLADRLAHVGATRIAVFFFEGDPIEGLAERRSIAIRRGLEQSGASFMIVDHPPGLIGQTAAWTGRLARRYRDCLLRLVGEIGVPSGEVRCSTSLGYAVGSDIELPASVGPPKLANANPALLPYLGRWEGDDEWGAYLILDAASITSSIIEFRAGFAEGVGSGRPPATGYYIFELDERDGSIVDKSHGRGALKARFAAPAELEVTSNMPDHNGRLTARRILLHKRTEQATAP
jgi:hypothetical protein